MAITTSATQPMRMAASIASSIGRLPVMRPPAIRLERRANGHPFSRPEAQGNARIDPALFTPYIGVSMVDTTTTKGSSDTALPDTGEAGAPGIEITTAMVE